MDGTAKGERDERESQPPHADPTSFQDASRDRFPHTRASDLRHDFYVMYKMKATDYDVDLVAKYDGDLNTTLIVAGLFSAVSTAFVIDVQSKLEPDPNEQSAALLRAILFALNQSAIPGGVPAVPPPQESPPSGIVTVTGLMYASLLTSLLAAFVAMLGKQWLDRYLRHSGQSMIERCGDRQRKCDGLRKWPLDFFIQGLSMILQVALLLLCCALSKHMAIINNTVALVVITPIILGVVFYLGVTIAGALSYDCPFQTLGSFALRRLWAKIRPFLYTATFPIVAVVPPIVTALRNLLEIIHCRILHIIIRFPDITIRSPHIEIPHCFHSMLEWVQLKVLRVALRHPPLPTIHQHSHSPITPRSFPWLAPADLHTIHVTNAIHVRCVSWILWNITDPEALNAAIRLAGTIWWFEDEVHWIFPYSGAILFTFEACFDSNGELYPGSRDRAYHSGRAILWINTLFQCKFWAWRPFLSPTIRCSAPTHDHDLTHLLDIIATPSTSDHFAHLLSTNPGHSPLHLQWVSNVLLHLSWANRDIYHLDLTQLQISRAEITIPLEAILNRLLTWCIFLGFPPEEEALKIEVKSDYLDQILHRLTDAISSSITAPYPQCKLVLHMLLDLTKLKAHTPSLTEIAYGWCSVICGNQPYFEDWESLLFLSLEIGFRHLNPEQPSSAKLTHTKHHQKLADIVFKSGEMEAVADLLQAWTLRRDPHHRPDTPLNILARHFIGLNCQVPFSTRLSRLVIQAIEAIDNQRFEEVGMESFVGLLNHLNVSSYHMGNKNKWMVLLLGAIQSPEGAQSLSLQSWKFMVEYTTLESQKLGDGFYKPHIASSLEKAQEWDKLECWMGIVQMACPPAANDLAKKEELEHVMIPLFQQKTHTAQKLEQWIKQSQEGGEEIPGTFQQICKQCHTLASLLPDDRAEGPSYSSPPILSGGHA